MFALPYLIGLLQISKHVKRGKFTFSSCKVHQFVNILTA
jgi:hypothetical protein